MYKYFYIQTLTDIKSHHKEISKWNIHFVINRSCPIWYISLFYKWTIQHDFLINKQISPHNFILNVVDIFLASTPDSNRTISSLGYKGVKTESLRTAIPQNIIVLWIQTYFYTCVIYQRFVVVGHQATSTNTEMVLYFALCFLKVIFKISYVFQVSLSPPVWGNS